MIEFNEPVLVFVRVRKKMFLWAYQYGKKGQVILDVVLVWYLDILRGIDIIDYILLLVSGDFGVLPIW